MCWVAGSNKLDKDGSGVRHNNAVIMEGLRFRNRGFRTSNRKLKIKRVVK
jgi:hypothetical protein